MFAPEGVNALINTPKSEESLENLESTGSPGRSESLEKLEKLEKLGTLPLSQQRYVVIICVGSAREGYRVPICIQIMWYLYAETTLGEHVIVEILALITIL
jgi:hypothetical protein